MKTDKERYQELEAQGKCPNCSSHLPDNSMTITCQDCRDKRTARKKRVKAPTQAQHKAKIQAIRERRQARRDAGCCIQCGSPLDGKSKAFCDKHAAMNREYKKGKRKLEYALAKRFGFCIDHPDREAVPGTARCSYCIDANTEASNRSKVAKREAARALGNCPRCFKRPAKGGHVKCGACIAKARKAARIRKRRKELRRQGLELIAIGTAGSSASGLGR